MKRRNKKNSKQPFSCKSDRLEFFKKIATQLSLTNQELKDLFEETYPSGSMSNISSDQLRSLFDEELGPVALPNLDGLIVDEKSILKNLIMSGSKTLFRGASDTETHGLISEISRLLKEKGYHDLSIGESSYFDEKMEKLITDFQKNNTHLGPFVSGAVDARTIIALESASANKFEPQPEARPSTSSAPTAPTPIASIAESPSNAIPDISSDESVFKNIIFKSAPCLNCASLAKRESEKAWDNGNVSEKDSPSELYNPEDTIMKYYYYTSKNNSWEKNIDRWGFNGKRTYGPRAGEHQMNPVKKREKRKVNGEWIDVAADWYHWSAVYISWVMGQHDGEGAKWFVSESHGPYVAAFKKKRREIEKNPDNHIGKMYYLWFSKEEKDKYNLKLEPGDLVGRPAHCDIYVGNGMMIGGNTCAKNESTGNKKKNCGGTSGPQPVKWLSGSGMIKRVVISGSTTSRVS